MKIYRVALKVDYCSYHNKKTRAKIRKAIQDLPILVESRIPEKGRLEASVSQHGCCEDKTLEIEIGLRPYGEMTHFSGLEKLDPTKYRMMFISGKHKLNGFGCGNVHIFTGKNPPYHFVLFGD